MVLWLWWYSRKFANDSDDNCDDKDEDDCDGNTNTENNQEDDGRANKVALIHWTSNILEILLSFLAW